MQRYYSATFKNLSDEIYSTSDKINSSYISLANDLLELSSVSNCSSTRFDLINFCDFIGDTTEYDARLIVIFSAFLGVFGFVLLYSFLVVFNGFSAGEKDYEADEYGYSYKSSEKIKNNNYRSFKSKSKKVSGNRDEEEEDEDEDEEDCSN